MTCIDILESYNMFVVEDKNSREFLINELKLEFEGNIARRDGIIMRKEIVILLKSYLENSK